MARRKRESLRKKKKEWFSKGTKSRKALVAFCITLVSLLLLAVLGFYQLLNWLQGDGFRESLSESICDNVQAEKVTIPHNLTIQGNRIALPSVHVERKALVCDVKAEHISSEVDRGALWWDRQLRLNHLTVEELSVSMDSALAEEELPETEPAEESFWDCFTPKETVVTSFECKNTNLTLRLAGQDYSITGSSVSAQPIEQGWQVDFVSGRVLTPLYYLKSCGISPKDKATLFITNNSDGEPEKYDLRDCCIQLSPGELNINGFYRTSDKFWSTDLNLSNANVERVLTEDWKKRISGDLNGSYLELRGRDSKLKKATGEIRLNNGKLEALPFISNFEMGGTQPFRTIPLSLATCKVSYPYNDDARGISNAWLFYDIDVRSKDETSPKKDQLRLKGYVILGTDAERSLGGTLCLGISEDFLKRYGMHDDPVLNELFTGEGDPGFRWINIDLSGTLDEPGQNLSARIPAIMAAMAGKSIKNAGHALIGAFTGRKKSKNEETPAPEPEQDDSGADDLPDTPEAPAAEKSGKDLIDHAAEGAGELIDSAADSASELINSGLNLLPL